MANSKEYAVTFSEQMVRASLAGLKTEHRRPVVGAPSELGFGGFIVESSRRRDEGKALFADQLPLSRRIKRVRCPYKQGDRIWVREAFTWITGNGMRIWYRADGEPTASDGSVLPTDACLPRWAKAGTMKRFNSRLVFEITKVRCERVTAITEEQAKAEGVVPLTALAPDQRIISDEIRTQGSHPYTLAFAVDWDTRYFERGYGWINAPHAWVLSLEPVKL